MSSLSNENWVYDEDNTSKSKKADEVLRKTKAARAGKKYRHRIICNMPLTIIEEEDVFGTELYGKSK